MQNSKIDISNPPESMASIEASIKDIGLNIKATNLKMLQGLALFAVAFTALLYLMINHRTYAEMPSLFVIGWGLAVLSILLVSASPVNEEALKAQLLANSPVTKEACVELLKMAKDSKEINNYCVAIAALGREITNKEFEAMKSHYTEAKQQVACSELYALPLQS